MKTELKETLVNILKMDGSIDQERINLALAVLDGKELVPSPSAKAAPSATELLAHAGRILPCTKVAEMLGVTTQCLRNWRKKENGLKPFVAPGCSRAAGYLEGDVVAYLEGVMGRAMPSAAS